MIFVLFTGAGLLMFSGAVSIVGMFKPTPLKDFWVPVALSCWLAAVVLIVIGFVGILV